ncbi:MAG: hypothetical protein ISR34_10660, partial [Pirellulales bacterium]|nr:hypothetical protein [Pirellulales bacterium]
NDIALVRLLGDYDYVSNNQPTLDALSDLEIDRDAAEQTISLSGVTAGGENQVLRVTATSDNQSLIPDPAVTYTSPDTTGSLALTPAAGQMGTATITVTVEDAGNDDDFDAAGDNASYVRTFVVTVAPRTDTPAVFTGDLTGIVAASGEATGAVAATDVDGITAGAPYELQLQAESGHAIVFGSTGQWVYVPGQEFDGSDTFTVRVTDDFGWTTDQVISVTGTPRSNNETLPDIYINQSTADQTASMQVPLVSVVSPPSGNLPTRVIATSSNAAIVPNPTTIYTSADVPGGLSFSPAIDQAGVVTINLSIEDGGPDKDLATAADNVFASQSFDITVLELLPNQGATALSKDGSEQLYAEAQPVMYQQQQVEVDIFGWQALGAEDDASGKSLLASRSGTTNRILTDDTWRIGSMFHDLTNETSLTLNEDARVQEFSLSTVVGAYVINGQQNPTLTVYRGLTYALNLNVPGHPFYLQTTNGSGYQSQNVYSSGFDGNGETTGTYTWTVPLDAPNELFYQCQLHAVMNGRIIISDLPSNGE